MFKPIRVITLSLLSLILAAGCTSTTTTVDSGRVDKNLLTEQHAESRSRQVLSVNYRLSLDIGKASERFSGQMAIDFELAANNTKPLTVDFEAGQIERLTVNGKTIDSNYTRYFLTIAPEHLKPGKNTIVIAYNRPYATNGTGFHRREDSDTGDVYLYSDFQPYNANRMFPLFDQPDLKASFTLDVKAPKDWELISTTREHKIEDIGEQKHWFFGETAVIPAYVFSLHAGPYHKWEDNSGKYPLRLFARKEVVEYIDAEFWFEATHKSMDFLERYFDVPYPYVKYDQIIVPDYNAGAMENVAAVTFNEDSFVVEEGMTKAEKEDLADTIAHEAAHMWFGNLVTMQWWNGLWLNESFASYMAIVTMDKGMNYEDAWTTFNANYKRWGYSADQRVTTHPIELPVADTDVAESIFDGITYGKGSAVVAQLSHYVGAEGFQKGLQNYMKKYAGGNTTLDDFMGELAKASGKDLTRWTKDWLYAAGVNTIYADVQCTNGKVSKATIYQNPDNAAKILREHRINVGFYGLNNDKVVLNDKYELTLTGKAKDIPQAVGAGCPPFVYANTDDLGYVKVDLQAPSVEFLEKHLSDIENPQMRTMLWQDLWHKVRYASMPIEKFVKVAKSHFDKEQDPAVKVMINNNIYAAYNYLTKIPGDKAKQQMLEIEQFAWKQINAAPDDLEAQKEAFNMFSSLAHSSWGLDKIRAILVGEFEVKGMPVTQNIRWDLVKRLNRFAHKDYIALTDKEFAADNDQVELDKAIIVRPSLESKSPWLNRFVEEPKAVKLSIMRSMMSWAFPSNQMDLFEQNQQRYIDGLETLTESANMMYQKAYARRLIRGSCSKESVARLEQAVERYRHLGSSLHDILRVAHQADEQCYKVKSFNL